MNGIEKITQRIADECREKCRVLTEEAEKRCAAVQAEYEAEAIAAYEAKLAEGKEEIEQEMQRSERNVRLDAKKDILAVKQELVNTAFDKARELILSMDKTRYVGFLAKLAADASSDGKEQLVFSAEDARSVGAEVVEAANKLLAASGRNASLTLSSEKRPMNGGLVLHNGDIEVNCTVDALLDQSRNELAAQIVGILFQ